MLNSVVPRSRSHSKVAAGATGGSPEQIPPMSVHDCTQRDTVAMCSLEQLEGPCAFRTFHESSTAPPLMGTQPPRLERPEETSHATDMDAVTLARRLVFMDLSPK